MNRSQQENEFHRMTKAKRSPFVQTFAALCLAFFCLLTADSDVQAASANPPGQLTYQGFLTDGQGLPFGNASPTNVSVVFRIYDASEAGALKWSSEQTVTLDKGHFSVLLGEGSQHGSEPFTADLSNVFTGDSASDRYMEMQVGGVKITPRLRFLPAPYALLAKSANQLVGTDGNPVVNSASLTVSGSANAGSLNVTGTAMANAFVGDGAGLTDLDANKITTGTLGVARVPALDAAKITSGTLDDARVSGSMARRNAANTFTGLNVFTQDGSGSGTIQLGPNTAKTAGTPSGLLLFNGSGTRHGLFGYYPADGNIFRIGGYGGSHHDSEVGLTVHGDLQTDGDGNVNGGLNVGGNVGIGTTSPTQAKLVVSGATGGFAHNGGYLFTKESQFGSIHAAQHENNWSIYASGWVAANRYFAFSDERIKNVQGLSDSANDLATLRQIEIADYTFKDTVQKGRAQNKKVIAQQVEKSTRRLSAGLSESFRTFTRQPRWRMAG